MSLLLLYSGKYVLPADTLRFLHGPYSLMASAVGVLAEGEPCEAGIILDDSTTFEMLYLGGHDEQNKLLGGGFQIVSALPAFDAPDGAACIYNGTLYTCLSNVWSPISGGSSSNTVVFPSASGEPTDSPVTNTARYDPATQILWIFDGTRWNDYCVCGGESSSSSSSSSGSSGNCCSGSLFPPNGTLNYEFNSSGISLSSNVSYGASSFGFFEGDSWNTGFAINDEAGHKWNVGFLFICLQSALQLHYVVNQLASNDTLVGTWSGYLTPTSVTCSPPDIEYPDLTAGSLTLTNIGLTL